MNTFLQSDRVFLSWLITDFCNYRCDYCGSSNTSASHRAWDVPAIIKMLHNTGKKWCVGLTGGEPMAWPHFISACQLLVNNDITLWIDTNLSIESRVREFAEKIPAAMVENLYISLHITERERHKQIDTFIKLMALLQSKEYKTQVNYVMDPRLLHRFAKDSEFFKTHGIELMAKPYEGVHRLKLYPESYTKGERRTILDSSPDAFRRTIFYPHGARCDAGRSLVRLLPDGTVTRCVADRTAQGTINTGIVLNDESLPCTVPCCSCFGWDLIDDENKKELMRQNLTDKPPLQSIARRYIGYYKRRIKKKLKQR